MASSGPAPGADRFAAGPAPLSDILITPALAARPSRAEDHRAENEALRKITRALGSSPRAALQLLCEQALALCRAESAGISIAEVEGDRDIFRWHATAGNLERFREATMPRDFSPCGVVVDSKSVQLMDRMVRHFAYVANLGIHLQEVLLVPFFRSDDIPIGTIWVVAHSQDKRFDREDSRLLQALADATSAIVDSYLRQLQLEQARAQLVDNAARLQVAIVRAEQSILDLQHERELRENFVAMLTHDLRSPLGAAKLALDLIQTEPALDVIQTYAARGARAIDRIEKMVTEMLDAGQARALGRTPLHFEHCDLRALLSHTVDGLADGHAGRVCLELAPGALEGYWDAEGVRRVVENLVSNGLKYGSSRGRVTISAAPLDGGVAVRVHNHGAPINEADRQRLFDTYSRVDAARRGKEQGWGLGLALVKLIAGAHGGRVEVVSSQEDGTTFTVWLPRDARPARLQAVAH